MPNKKNKSKQRRSLRRRRNVKSRKVMRGGGGENGYIEVINFPIVVHNNEIQKTKFPISYTVVEKLDDGSIRIHISKINDTPRTPAIALVVDDKYNLPHNHFNRFDILINDKTYLIEKIITGATASV